MKRTAAIGASNETVTCEKVGMTCYQGPHNRAIWKNVEDAYECFVLERGCFWHYEPRSYDDLGELYGTYIDDDGTRKEYVLEH